MTRDSSLAIRAFMLAAIGSGQKTPSRAASERFGISRQAVNRHLRALVAQGAIVSVGATKGRGYELATTEATRSYPFEPSLTEDRVWRGFVRPHLERISRNALAVCHHGLTEMVNNAIEHSEGSTVAVSLRRSAADVTLRVQDDGVGIFHKIRDAFDLDDEFEAVLELSKGKLTTDPARHTGEGIFFTSRMFDRFSIMSGSLFFSHAPEKEWILEDRQLASGTMIEMVVDVATTRRPSDVFDRCASADHDYRFSRTHVPVVLAKLGDDNLISRSQGKRLVSRFEQFEEVILDFVGVDTIGQSFADEVFRVFASGNPGTRLLWRNTTREVGKMIRRALSGAPSRDRLDGAR